MAALKMKVLLAAVVVALAVQNVAASTEEAPAPSPTADSAAFVPAMVASVAAMAFGMLF